MNNILIIFTDKYPYGNGETYVETERPYWKSFKKVYICPVLATSADKIREGFCCKEYEELISVIDEKPTGKNYIYGLFGPLSITVFAKELKSLINKREVSIKKVYDMLAMQIVSNNRYRRIKWKIKNIIEKNEKSGILLYSYWMYEPALVAIGIKKDFGLPRIISRAHRYDLYEYWHKIGYIPYREYTLGNIDRIYSISDDGRNYIHERYQGKYDDKVFVERLGTEKYFHDYSGEEDKTIITIVSCSNIIPVKRVGRIPKVLTKSKKRIQWYHFGDGPNREEVEQQIRELPPNVNAYLMGYTPNINIQKFYSEHYIDAFINVSDSEGVPVSIMEAMSYSIPIIATNAGGTGELVRENDGVLLPLDYSDKELLEAIDLVKENQSHFRAQSGLIWNKLSNAEINFRSFFEREKKI